jgi:uncharacterized protein YdaU (DUF1376 family)
VLFYTSDFLTGTGLLSDEQVGKYIRLLCYQHQKGILTERDMMNVCKTYDEDIWSKFVKTEEGYYNQRMKEEADKRRNYSESRRQNKLKAKKTEDMMNISSSYEQHMENENENINDNINVVIYDNIKIENKSKRFIKPELFEVQNYFEELGSLTEAEGFYNYYESNGWKVGRNPMKDWKAATRNWIKNAKNYKKNDTTKSSIDHYNERRENLYKIAAIIDAERGIRP